MSYASFWLWNLNLWMVCTMRSASLRKGWAWKENKPKPSYKSAKFSKYKYTSYCDILRTTTNKMSVNSDSGINNCHPTRAESHLMWRTSSRRQWQLFHHPWLMVKLREEVLSVVCFAKCLHNACILFVLCLHYVCIFVSGDEWHLFSHSLSPVFTHPRLKQLAKSGEQRWRLHLQHTDHPGSRRINCEVPGWSNQRFG